MDGYFEWAFGLHGEIAHRFTALARGSAHVYILHTDCQNPLLYRQSWRIRSAFSLNSNLQVEIILMISKDLLFHTQSKHDLCCEAWWSIGLLLSRMK